MLKVFASFAEDILLNENRHILKRQMGGPAFFIKNALDKMRAKFDLISSTPAQVELIMTEAGETETRLVVKPAAFTPCFGDIRASGVLISTTINEIHLNGIGNFSGFSFIDVQGYVRHPDDSSKHRMWKEGRGLDVLCLKTTKLEMGYLPGELITRQKEKILIVTKGSQGLDLYVKNKLYKLPVENKVTGSDTIGAGDTFLANFAANFLLTGHALNSAERAMSAVSDFLVSKPKLAHLGLR